MGHGGGAMSTKAATQTTALHTAYDIRRKKDKMAFPKALFGFFLTLSHFLTWLNQQSNEMREMQQLIITAKLLNSPHPKITGNSQMTTNQKY